MIVGEDKTQSSLIVNLRHCHHDSKQRRSGHPAIVLIVLCLRPTIINSVRLFAHRPPNRITQAWHHLTLSSGMLS